MRARIMLNGMMEFLDRASELQRLDALIRKRDGGLAVVHGRRRIGKMQLLVHWCRRRHGIYAVADQ
jgi:AAA+ ATPase superfamily predicted ATPase